MDQMRSGRREEMDPKPAILRRDAELEKMPPRTMIPKRRHERGYLRIKGDILNYLSKVGIATTKYQIVIGVNINYDIFYEAIKDLVEIGLVECRQSKKRINHHHWKAGIAKDIYILTDRGHEVSLLVQKLTDILTTKPVDTCH